MSKSMVFNGFPPINRPLLELLSHLSAADSEAPRPEGGRVRLRAALLVQLEPYNLLKQLHLGPRALVPELLHHFLARNARNHGHTAANQLIRAVFQDCRSAHMSHPSYRAV